MENSLNKRVVVVLGMHRSGTSVITRALKVMGIELGTKLMPPHDDNKKGYWEDLELVDLNEEILSFLNYTWDSLSEISDQDIDKVITQGFDRKAIDWLNRRMDNYPLFGCKDPRMAKLLPFWKKVFNQCNVDVCYVLAVRNPLSVAESLKKRDGFDLEKSYLMWIGHVLTSLKHSINNSHVLIDYDMLLNEPEYEILRMSQSLDLTVEPLNLKYFTDDFLDSNLCHSTYSLLDIKDDDYSYHLMNEIYGQLLAVVTSKTKLNDPAFIEMISKWDRGYKNISPILKMVDKVILNSNELLSDRDGQIAGLNEAVADREGQIAGLNEAVADRDEQIAGLNEAVADRDGQIAGLNEAVADREGQIAGLNEAVADRDGQIAGLNEAVADREGQIAGLNEAVADRDGQIAGLNEAVADRDGQIAGLSETTQELYAGIADRDALIHEILNSNFWKIMKPFRFMGTIIKKMIHVTHLIPLAISKEGGVWNTCRKFMQVLNSDGISGLKVRVKFLVSRQHHFSNIKIVDENDESYYSIVPHYIDPHLSSIDPLYKEGILIAIHLHLVDVDIHQELVSYLNNMPVTYDLYVSIPKYHRVKGIEAFFLESLSKVNNVVVESVENYGMNIAPLIVQFGSRLSKYDIIGHFHTQRSNLNSVYCEERESLKCLLGEPNEGVTHIGQILNLLKGNGKIVYPEGYNKSLKDVVRWGIHYNQAEEILKNYTSISINDFLKVEFSESSMFWANTSCINDFLTLPLNFKQFRNKLPSEDGTLADALKRLLLIFTTPYEGVCYRIHQGDSITDYRYYEDQRDYSKKISKPKIKILSYYLPQFHPIPENDLWHGKGFTEWTSVRAANPLFKGHYQQHIPHEDIGYYLIDSPDTLKIQADQMRKAGVYGQIFYHYWFSGKLILEEPAKMLLENSDILMPFCFCWANENWTRCWDGNEDEILLGQDYSAQDARDFIQYLIPFFKDSRYICIDNRPVLYVYRPTSISNSQEYLDIWKKECTDAGLKPPYVVAVLTRGASTPKDFGMDAGIERVLHDWTEGAVPEMKDSLDQYESMTGSVLSYGDVANFYMKQTKSKDFTYFRSLVPIWDNTARYDKKALLLHGSNPQLFQKWLESSIDYSQQTLADDRQFIVINAWNEWGEGAHLEPDTRFGYSYLNAVGRALSEIESSDEDMIQCTLPSNMKVHITLTSFVSDELKKDKRLKKHFLRCLSKTTMLGNCILTTDSSDLLKEFPKIEKSHINDVDFILKFRTISLFDPLAIERIFKVATASGSSVISNNYGELCSLMDVTDNFSVDSSTAYDSSILLSPIKAIKNGYKNIRLCSDAWSFVTSPSKLPQSKMPIVTTIIRFHKTADLNELRHALYCLYAMQNCVVVPLIAVQDLTQQQLDALKNILDEFDWDKVCAPQVDVYQSSDGHGDLRSLMLNKSLKKVKTRYAAFLDFDDLLMPHAYDWLIQRIKLTGKAVSFGRVYHTPTNSFLVSRECLYQYGSSYDDFFNNNHAPLHSFMLDLEKLDVSNLLYYDDQKYMEDYFMTLQLFTKENSDWDSLKENYYIGDYIQNMNREHTLALTNEENRQKILSDPEYKKCEQRICGIRKTIKSKVPTQGG